MPHSVVSMTTRQFASTSLYERCLGDSCTISLPKSPSELPLFDFDLLDFLDLLGVENAVKLFVCALLEHQVSRQYLLCWPNNVVKGCVSRSFNHATFNPVFWPAEYRLTIVLGDTDFVDLKMRFGP